MCILCIILIFIIHLFISIFPELWFRNVSVAREHNKHAHVINQINIVINSDLRWPAPCTNSSALISLNSRFPQIVLYNKYSFKDRRERKVLFRHHLCSAITIVLSNKFWSDNETYEHVTIVIVIKVVKNRNCTLLRNTCVE